VTYHPLDRTGLDGALSATIEITGAGAPIDPAGVPGARVRLCAGGAAIAAGLAEAAAEAGISYSAQRQQFGGPLIDLPARIDGLAAMAARAAGLVRRAVHPAPMTPWQAAALLGDACESAIDVCADAVQALGGYGYLTEYPVERMLRDAVSLRAATAALAAARNDASELTTK
jgi:alkylation response protein AidB-like acyl-CoA dehydrogenase